MNYPQGVKRHTNRRKGHNQVNNATYANRGMTLEEDINETNQYYILTNQAVVHKKPTPIQVVNVHYPKRSAAKITEGYFQSKATTDYNGIYKGKYIDFEAKETQNKTTFPLANIHEHQIEHMRAVIKHGGICFVLLRFVVHEETYLLPSKFMIEAWDAMQEGARKSIPFDMIQHNGYKVPFTYQAKVDYLKIVDKLYFK